MYHREMLWAPLALTAMLVQGAPAALTIHLHIRVALCPDGSTSRVPARGSPWIDETLTGVRAILRPAGVAVTADSDVFTPPRCQVVTRDERDEFASQVVASDGGVTILVVPSVRDLRVPSYQLRGVHWRAGGRDWIFLTERGHAPALTHEIGHYFRLPHDPAGGNLMTPGPSSPAWQSAHPPRPFAPLLVPAQVRRLRAGIVDRRPVDPHL
jgi:hypothetical protein